MTRILHPLRYNYGPTEKPLLAALAYTMVGSCLTCQMVKNEYNSDVMPIDGGVPQGSVLGPLIFLVYTNDLPTAIQHNKVHHFADDTSRFIQVSKK